MNDRTIVFFNRKEKKRESENIRNGWNRLIAQNEVIDRDEKERAKRIFSNVSRRQLGISLSLSINVHGNGRTGLNGPQGQVRGLKRAGTPIIPWNSRIPRSLPPRLFP